MKTMKKNNEEEDEEAYVIHRKTLTKNRLVNSIEAAQDMNNFDPHVLPTNHVTYKSKYIEVNEV